MDTAKALFNSVVNLPVAAQNARQYMHPLQFFAVTLCGLAAGQAAAAGRIEKALIAITKAPFVPVLLPGCTARELPPQLNNLNSRVCTPDGQLCVPGEANDENLTLPRAKVAS